MGFFPSINLFKLTSVIYEENPVSLLSGWQVQRISGPFQKWQKWFKSDWLHCEPYSVISVKTKNKKTALHAQIVCIGTVAHYLTSWFDHIQPAQIIHNNNKQTRTYIKRWRTQAGLIIHKDWFSGIKTGPFFMNYILITIAKYNW